MYFQGIAVGTFRVGRDRGTPGAGAARPPGIPAHLRCSSSCAYRKWTSALLATISAWQSLTTSPWSLMYSPLMHLVPDDRTTTWACLTSRPGGQRRRQSPVAAALPVGQWVCSPPHPAPPPSPPCIQASSSPVNSQPVGQKVLGGGGVCAHLAHL